MICVIENFFLWHSHINDLHGYRILGLPHLFHLHYLSHGGCSSIVSWYINLVRISLQSAEYFCFVICFFYLDVCLFGKFNNFTKLCFSVFYLLFLLNTLTTFHLYIYSFILRIFPNLSLNIFPIPQEFFSSSLGTPIIHILDFWGFSSKAVNFPVIALFLHSFPCVIGSSFLSAPLIWQWLT